MLPASARSIPDEGETDNKPLLNTSGGRPGSHVPPAPFHRVSVPGRRP